MSSFGEDQSGNLFIVDHNSGSAFKLVPGGPITPPDPNLTTHYFLSRDGSWHCGDWPRLLQEHRRG